jgi:hypothetical protein
VTQHSGTNPVKSFRQSSRQPSEQTSEQARNLGNQSSDDAASLHHSSSMSTLLRFLTSPLALSLAVLLLLSYACLHAITNRRLLRNFRGPLLAKSSRSWLFWNSVRARVNVAQFEALQQHGKSS